MIMNCQNPQDQNSINLANELSKKYNATVMPMNCLDLNIEDINQIFSKLLYEFVIDKISWGDFQEKCWNYQPGFSLCL